MIEKLTKQEILQIQQDIKAQETEQKKIRNGKRVSQIDRQVAINEVATSYGMPDIELARHGAEVQLMIEEMRQKHAAEAQLMIEQMGQKQTAELEALRVAIASLGKPTTKKANGDLFEGVYVRVSQVKGKPESYRIKGRAIGDNLHVTYVKGLAEANSAAEYIERLIDSVLANQAAIKKATAVTP